MLVTWNVHARNHPVSDRSLRKLGRRDLRSLCARGSGRLVHPLAVEARGVDAGDRALPFERGGGAPGVFGGGVGECLHATSFPGLHHPGHGLPLLYAPTDARVAAAVGTIRSTSPYRGERSRSVDALQ